MCLSINVLSSLYFNTGITLSGLESPLTVGQPATITCTTNIEVSSIEWRDETFAILNSATDQTVVEYTIPLVRDDLQGLQYTCRAVAGTTIYTETVEIQVVGKSMSPPFCETICMYASLLDIMYMYIYFNHQLSTES